MRRPLLSAALLALALALASGCTQQAGNRALRPTETPSPEAPSIVPTTVAPRVTHTPPTATASPSPDEQSPRPGLETAPPVGLPTCKGSALTVTDADTLVTMTNRQEVYALRTTGSNCQLKGYPTVSFRDAAGHPMAIRVQHGGFGLPAEPPSTVTISRSTSLSFVIASARDGACSDVAKVVVTLPMTTGTHVVATSLRVCGGQVGLSPVHRQADHE